MNITIKAELISPEERRRRQESANFAEASVGLEGYKITNEDRVLTQCYIAGEITLQDAIKAVHDAIKVTA